MSVTEIIITVALGVLVNLITPSIRRALFWLSTSAITKAQFTSISIFRTRLKQLESEREYIEGLYTNPILAANILANSALPQVIVFWLVTLALIVAVYLSDESVQISRLGASGIFGMISYAARFPFLTILALKNIEKLNNIEAFREKNDREKQKISEMIEKLVK